MLNEAVLGRNGTVHDSYKPTSVKLSGNIQVTFLLYFWCGVVKYVLTDYVHR